MRDTIAAFMVLGLAAAAPTPFDLGLGFIVLLGLLARDRTTWGRQIAVFMWMVSRIWPALVQDPYRVYDVCIFIIGFGGFHMRWIDKVETKFVRELIEALYAVVLLMPLHDAPHVVMSVAFDVSVCTEWYVSTDESKRRPDVLIRPFIWMLCIRSTLLTSVCAFAYSVWIMRKHVSVPTRPVVTTPAPRPSSAPRSKRIHSVRVPTTYILRQTPVIASSSLIEEEEEEEKSYPPITSDMI